MTSTSGPPAPPGTHLYAVALGSNRPLARGAGPIAIVRAAFAALDEAPLRLIARSRILTSRPIGPSRRSYANAAALVESMLPPLAMLDHLQAIERRFGRRRHRRWGARTLDLDLLLWSGGKVDHRRLTIPHAAMAERDFVLLPLRDIAPDWRDPRTGRTMKQLAARLARTQPAR